ncbi:hypothetical protein N0V90_007342 [Kalmusia sp. IMI 367209]|nr:hypothetical protein N0V90_007342 [Kalmusia sp. IMI 367209]
MVKTKATPQDGTHKQVTLSAIVGPSVIDVTQEHNPITTHQFSEVVKTFLFSAVSTILWVRDLLPDSYFRTVFYASINKYCSYRDFTYGRVDQAVAQSDRPRSKGYHLRVLKRDASIRGDQIIKWLASVFEAIQLGYLSQLQISIFADANRPREVLELYCFHFQYLPSRDGSIVANIEVEDVKNKRAVSLKDAREALNTVIKNMVGLNGTMPCLPERCYMSPYLVWNERRPSGYQPPGFHPYGDENISFPVTEGWAIETSICGNIKAGPQAVNLGVAYMKEIGFNDSGEAVVMPDFNYGETFNRLEAAHPGADLH